MHIHILNGKGLCPVYHRTGVQAAAISGRDQLAAISWQRAAGISLQRGAGSGQLFGLAGSFGFVSPDCALPACDFQRAFLRSVVTRNPYHGWIGRAELHWYKAHGSGRRKFKIKNFLE